VAEVALAVETATVMEMAMAMEMEIAEKATAPRRPQTQGG